MMGEEQVKQVEEAVKKEQDPLAEAIQAFKEYAETNPDVDLTIVTARPEGMDFNLYKLLRKSSNKAIKEYLRK